MAKQKTQAQQAAEAANAALAPQEQLYGDLQSQAAEQQARELASALGFTNAAADVAKGYAPAVQGVYQGAAETQGALAKGFSDGFRMSENQQAGSINSFLGKQGAPSGQMLQGDTGAADVMFGLGGYIPGSTFAREGAAFGAAAANYPNTVMGVGMAYQRQVNQKYSDLQKQYSSELKALKAQSPQLYQQALQGLQQAALGSREMALKEFLATQEWGYKRAEAKAKAKLPPEANSSLSRSLGYLVDDYGNPLTDNKGNLRPVTGYNTGGSKSKDAKAKRQEQFMKIRAQAFDKAASYLPKTDVLGNKVEGLSRKEALKRLQIEYRPILRSIGVSEGIIRQMLRRAIASAYGTGT